MSGKIPFFKRFKDMLIRNQKTIGIVASFTVPILIALIMGIIERKSLKGIFLWFVESPVYAWLSFAFVALLFIAVLAVTERPFIATLIVSVPLITIACISALKRSIRELPVFPWNIKLIKEIFKDSSLLGSTVWLYVLAGIIAVVIIIIFFIHILGVVKLNITPTKRIVAVILAVVLMIPCVTILSKGVPTDKNSDEGAEMYDKRGLVGSVLAQFRSPVMEEPENYSEDAVEEIYGSMEGYSDSSSSNERPDIIMVMGEAFWDPTRLEKVSFSEDPLKNYHRLQNESIYGNLVVEAYGGNTTNSEYSALTSICTSLLSPELTCYTDMTDLNTPISVAEHLRSLGYNADAVHPGLNTYLCRDEVFEKFGFENFYSDEDFENPTVVGSYISDDDAANKIIEIYEKHKKENPENPYFAFMTTIESHYNFDIDNYIDTFGSYPIEVTTPNDMDEENAEMIKGYTQYVHDTDAMIGKLTDYFKAQDRDVIFIVFGDHLPAIGENFTAYYEGGYINREDPMNENGFNSEVIKLHSTPFLIWDNYTERESGKDIGKISSCYLVPVALNEYNVPMTRYQYFLSEIYEDYPHFGLSYYNGTDPWRNSKIENNLRILQYDILYNDSSRSK